MPSPQGGMAYTALAAPLDAHANGLQSCMSNMYPLLQDLVLMLDTQHAVNMEAVQETRQPVSVMKNAMCVLIAAVICKAYATKVHIYLM